MPQSEITAAGCGQLVLYGRTGLNQGAAKPIRGRHEITIAGNKFCISRTGSVTEDCLPKTAAKVYLLWLPIADATEAPAEEGRFATKRSHGFFSGSINITLQRLLIAQPANHFLFAFEATALEEAWAGLVGKPSFHGFHLDGAIDLAASNESHLTILVDLIWNCLDAPGEYRLRHETIECLFQAVISALCHVIVASPLRQPARHASPAMPWHVKRAVAYMCANLGNPMAVATVAREVGTGVRALQVAFKRFRGTTPLGYLQTIRLEAARKGLLNSTSSLSISHVARKAGFTHMGRFAAAYCKKYGEKPSETLRMQALASARDDEKALHKSPRQ